MRPSLSSLAICLLGCYAQVASAGLFGGSESTTAAVASSSDAPASTGGNTTTAPAVSSEVAFLQTLQVAQISSMSCLITLVNMTTNSIGSCLSLNALAPLIVAPSENASFSAQLSTYLGTVCGGTQCADTDLKEAKSLLDQTCDGSKNTDLVQVLGAILDNYTNSYRTLACSVHFNGTADLCLPSTLNTSETANHNYFFNDLVTGQDDLQQYQGSVFSQAECTGCTHEMYKAAVYMLPQIRGKDLTRSIGGHLQNDCGDAAGVNWSDVQDEQIPNALQVQQSTPVVGGDATRALSSLGWKEIFFGLAVVYTSWFISRPRLVS